MKVYAVVGQELVLVVLLIKVLLVQPIFTETLVVHLTQYKAQALGAVAVAVLVQMVKQFLGVQTQIQVAQEVLEQTHFQVG
jgi:hypothetical protein